MKKVITNILISIVILTSLVGLIGFSVNKSASERINLPTTPMENSTISKPTQTPVDKLTKKEIQKKSLATKQVSHAKNSKQKFMPGVKLNSYQAVAYKKTDPKKTKLLHCILSNKTKRNKFKYVMKKAEELHLPKELALIPVIESEYKDKAVSNKGAGGLWQLMPGTARIFGLSSKQRFEMASSTRAALRHLKDLYKEYDGNWELAIAAYNAGDGRVNKALSRNSHAKTVQELRLPRETRNYVLSFFQLQKALKSYSLT